MGWRFRRTIKLFPGVRLNLSKSGISTSIGVPGATLNVGKKGAYFTGGIPGTGISYREKLKDYRKENSPDSKTETPYYPLVPDDTEEKVPDYAKIESKSAYEITSPGLSALVKVVQEALAHRNTLITEGAEATKEMDALNTQITRWGLYPFGKYLFKNRLLCLRTELAEVEESYSTLKRQLEELIIHITSDKQLDALREFITPFYEGLLSCDKIWDVTSTELEGITNDNIEHVKMNLKPVIVDHACPSPVRSDVPPVHFQNANGKDLYFFDAFIFVCDPNIKENEIGIIDLREVEIKYSKCTYQQRDPIPRDCYIEKQMWAYANKDGSENKRVSNNYLIKEVIYGKLTFTSASGLNEQYLFSNAERASQFAAAIAAYIEKGLAGNISFSSGRG